MELEQLKATQLTNPEDNYLVISFGFREKLVLPFSEGMDLLRALAQAEHYSDDCILPLSPEQSPKFKLLSALDYQALRTAGLLDVPVTAVRTAHCNHLRKQVDLPPKEINL